MDAIGAQIDFAPRGSTRLWFGFAGEAAIGLMAGALAMSGTTAAAKGIGIFCIVLGIGFPMCYWLWLSNTRLIVGSGVVGYQNLLAQRRIWPVSQIARVLQLTIVYHSKYGDQRKPALLLVGADGSCLQKVRVAAWSGDALEAFISATGRAPEPVETYDSNQAAKEFPGSVGFMYAHTAWTTLIAAGIVVAALALFEWWVHS